MFGFKIRYGEPETESKTTTEISSTVFHISENNNVMNKMALQCSRFRLQLRNPTPEFISMLREELASIKR